MFTFNKQDRVTDHFSPSEKKKNVSKLKNKKELTRLAFILDFLFKFFLKPFVLSFRKTRDEATSPKNIITF